MAITTVVSHGIGSIRSTSSQPITVSLCAPRMRKGEFATVMTNGTPMNSIRPKEDRTARPADNTPTPATQALFLTQSNLETRKIRKLNPDVSKSQI